MSGGTKRKFSSAAGRGLVGPVLLALAGLASPSRSAWTISGTTVQVDGMTGHGDVRVTVFPDSLVSVSDQHGDFLISWSGVRGWLTFDLPEKGRDGSHLCFRYALFPRPIDGRDSTLDIGAWRLDPNMPILPPSPPVPPTGELMLPRLRLPGPQPGEPDHYRQVLRVYVDLWGRADRVEEGEGDPNPTRVRDALRDHLMKIPWVVQLDTPCGDRTPFSNELKCFYQWQDSVWAPLAQWAPPPYPPRPVPVKATGSPIARPK